MNSDTIAAIATAPGRGAIAIVRVSGPDAFAIAAALAGRRPEPGRMIFARWHDAAGLPVDEGVVLAFAAPHSYTGEDVVEFQGHGGMRAPQRVLAAVLAAGARLARRGEFTERAFLNGKLGYPAAEAVIDLIDAKTDRAAEAALSALSGRSEREGRALYERLLALSSELEHALDVDEGELPERFVAAKAAELEGLRGELAAAIRRVREGRWLREGALVVLAGPPNVGKSSLLNALLGAERAIVSAQPGTTRDSIEEWMDIGGWPVRLADTAGIRDAEDPVEAEGVRRAAALAAAAQLTLRLYDAGEAPAARPRELRVRTKGDLLDAGAVAAARSAGAVVVSAKSGAGLTELTAAIAAHLAELAGAADESAGTFEPMLAALIETQALLPAAVERELVVIANAVRSAALRLGRALGAEYADDLLERLFARFCVGK